VTAAVNATAIVMSLAASGRRESRALVVREWCLRLVRVDIPKTRDEKPCRWCPAVRRFHVLQATRCASISCRRTLGRHATVKGRSRGRLNTDAIQIRSRGVTLECGTGTFRPPQPPIAFTPVLLVIPRTQKPNRPERRIPLDSNGTLAGGVGACRAPLNLSNVKVTVGPREG